MSALQSALIRPGGIVSEHVDCHGWFLILSQAERTRACTECICDGAWLVVLFKSLASTCLS